MKKPFLILTIQFMLLCVAMRCLFKRKKSPAFKQATITVTGNTRNVSGQAAVITDSTGTFYIAGMKEWEKDLLNHHVKVIGDAESDTSTTNSGSAIPEKKIIRAALIMIEQDEAGYNY